MTSVEHDKEHKEPKEHKHVPGHHEHNHRDGYKDEAEEAKDNETRLAVLTKLIQPNSNLSLLDLGCGNGKFLLKIAPMLKQVNGVDGHKNRIDDFQRALKAQSVSNASAAVMDAHELEFQNESFDIVTCHRSFHHFSDGEKVLKEIFRVLKLGGLMIINDRVSPDRTDFEEYITALGKMRDSSYERTFTKLDWERLLADNNFELEHLEVKREAVNVTKWLEHSPLDQVQKDRILDFLASAPLDVKEYFKIEINEGRAAEFDTEGVWIKARRC